jgi:hypothetical protein
MICSHSRKNYEADRIKLALLKHDTFKKISLRQRIVTCD